jgi:hypothetical protein
MDKRPERIVQRRKRNNRQTPVQGFRQQIKGENKELKHIGEELDRCQGKIDVLGR